MIVWIASLATPQFAGILNQLDRRQPGLIEVRYLEEGSGGRDWGVLDIAHTHEYAHHGIRTFFDGFRLVAGSKVANLVAFGYTSRFSIGALLAARILRKQVFTQSDSSFQQHSERPWWIRTMKFWFISILYSRRTRVWVIGDDNARFWNTFGLMNQSRVNFESPVATDISSSDSRIPYLRIPYLRQRESNVSPQRLALYVGRLSPEKSIGDAIRAIGLAREGGTLIRLAIVGSGDTDLLMVDGKRPEWVDYVGSISHQDMGEMLTAADMLILPSMREPYGLVVREALQFGLPVVASTAVTAARELCNEGWNIVPVGDIHRLAEAITHAAHLTERWIPREPLDLSEFYERELVGQPPTRNSS